MIYHNQYQFWAIIIPSSENCTNLFWGWQNKNFFFSWFKSPPRLIISNGDYSLKQHNNVEYLACDLDSNLNKESRACRVPKNINRKLSFLWSQSIYLKYLYRRLLCNALIQAHFEYGCTISPLWLWCTSWYPLLCKTWKTKLQIAQNNYICFCLKLLPHCHINPSHFRKKTGFGLSTE